MQRLLDSLYENVEWWVILLSWVTVPLFFLAIFMILHNHYGFFDTRAALGRNKGEHGED